MPRIEIIPADFDPDSGDGSPTFDCCQDCSTEFEEGDNLPEAAIAALAESGHSFDTNAEIGSTEVVHPSYEEDDYNCALCGDPLTEDDD